MKKFLYKDKSGRGFTSTLTETDILEMEDEYDWSDQSLHDFVEDSTTGDEWETADTLIICL